MKCSLHLILLLTLSAGVLSARAQSPAPAPAQTPPGANAQTPPAGGGSATGAPPPEKTNPVRIPRFEAAPVIDGRLDEEVWNGAARLKDFYQIEPGDNSTPSRATEVLLGYDARTLYLAFRAHDDPSKVRATIARRDAVSGDDHVGIYLDTYNDKRKAYSLYFNPYGIQADAVFTEGVGEDYSVDVVMQSKGVVGDGGYVVEVAIPFKSLRYEAGKDKLWGVHVFRFIKRFDDERDSWMPISRDKSGTLSQAGHLTGLEDLWAGRTLEVIPTLTFSQTGRRVRALTPAAVGADPTLQDPGRFINPAVEADPGVTARLHVTPTVVLDLTVNPDFAQVEADQLVVTANQRFPIFFQERRPFFIEGIDIFRTPLRPLHTRAIVDPDFAVKLTGKRGRNTFGFLAASDKAPGNFSEDERTDPSVRPSIERFLDKNAYVGVLRLKRDVGKESSLGLIATTYNFIEKHNHLGGFDGRLRLDEQSVFTFQVLGTTSRRFFRDADLGRSLYRTGNGFAYDFNYQKSGRNLYVELFGTGRTRDYRADVGFTPRTDTNNEGVYVRYRTTPKPKAKLISWSVENYAYANFDWRGRSQNWVEDFNVGFNFARQTSFHVAYVKNYERLFEEEFGPRRTATRQGAFFGPDPERTTNKESYFAYGETTPSKKYSASFDFVYTTDEFDFDFGAGPRFPRVSPAALLDPDAPLDPGPGNELRLKLELKYQPTDELNVTFEYTKDRLVRSDTKRLAFADNLYDLRATYQFTRFMFARARVDYTTLFSNVRGQFLFGWTPNPGTSFYAGYNDDLSVNGFSPFTDQLEPGFRRNGRTFFIKMSYLFRRSL